MLLSLTLRVCAFVCVIYAIKVHCVRFTRIWLKKRTNFFLKSYVVRLNVVENPASIYFFHFAIIVAYLKPHVITRWKKETPSGSQSQTSPP